MRPARRTDSVLISWLLAGKTSFAVIAGGYSVANIAALACSLLLGLSVNLITVELIGYLGVVPIGLGIHALIGQMRGRNSPTETSQGSSAALGVAATLAANSTDSIIIFSPLLADSSKVFDIYVVSAYVVVAAAWFWVANAGSRRASKMVAVSNAAAWIAPGIMIIVGIYILANTATDVA